MCGVVGIYDVSHKENVAWLLYTCLLALQHRGKESAGIAIHNKKGLEQHGGMGTVEWVFKEKALQKLEGFCGIAHNRYSTTGGSKPENIQPILAEFNGEQFAIAHNGNLINTEELREECKGYPFHGDTDTEVIAALISQSGCQDFEEAVQKVLPKLKGAFALVFLFEEKVIGATDSLKIRPFCLGKRGDCYVLVSETCALDIIEASFVREVNPGEMIVLDGNGAKSIQWTKEAGLKTERKICMFEYIYFANPDSRLEGVTVGPARERMGAICAKENPANAQLVIAVPDSGTPAALGYYHQRLKDSLTSNPNNKNLPCFSCIGLLRRHSVGRTFIEPIIEKRATLQRIKFNPIPEIVSGKDLEVVDDSIVRASVAPRIIKLLRAAGAGKIHFRVPSPPVRFPCFFGIDIATFGELIAHTHIREEIEIIIGADSLYYISGVEAVARAIGKPLDQFCHACMSGKYPMEVNLEPPSRQNGLF